MHIAPILLGDGVHLFAREGGARVSLEKISVSEGGRVATLRFRVIK